MLKPGDVAIIKKMDPKSGSCIDKIPREWIGQRVLTQATSSGDPSWFSCIPIPPYTTAMKKKYNLVADYDRWGYRLPLQCHKGELHVMIENYGEDD